MRIKQLDLMRGVAILLVLGRHPVVFPEQAGYLGFFAGAWERFGWTGVDLFFVLSGFLIEGFCSLASRATAFICGIGT